MSSNEAGKVCFLALGAFVLVGGLSAILETVVAQRPLVVSSDEVSLPDALSSLGVSAAISVIGASLFSFLPGALIIYKGPQWADRWFPAREPDERIAQPPSAYYGVGVAILGVYFVVVGAGSFIGGLAQAILLWWANDTMGFQLSYASRSLASGASYLIGGFWLAAIGRRLARTAA